MEIGEIQSFRHVRRDHGDVVAVAGQTTGISHVPYLVARRNHHVNKENIRREDWCEEESEENKNVTPHFKGEYCALTAS